MKINLIHAVLLIGTLTSKAQGTFNNLNFELANPVSAGDPNDPSAVTAASGLPSWTVSSGNTTESEIPLNQVSTGATMVSLQSSSFQPIDGQYSVLLQGGLSAPSASISQVGLIPGGSESLIFKAQLELQSAPGQLDVSVDGQNVPVYAIANGPNYTLYGANISAWAGETEALTFSAVGHPGGLNSWLLDDISFSSSSVPEPSSALFISLGGLAFAARHRYTRKL